MSYPPPPGSTNQSASGYSTPQTHGLPARPPPATGSNATFAAFKPRSVAPSAASPAPAPQYNNPYGSYDMSASQYPSAAAPQSYYPGAPAPSYAAGGYSQQSPPQIRNPFAPPAAPGQGSLYGADYDPEYQAQIQAWQSAYAGKLDSSKDHGGNANSVPLGSGRVDTSTPATDTKTAAIEAANAKAKTVVRAGGGQEWEDPTLLEWGNHHRLFIGNLAGEVTDESLLKAFAKYPSVQKARVVRDKRTTKSKGFGFVSLADADEFFQAAKDMQGKYIGSHPVLIRRAETEIKAVNKKDDKNKYGKNRGKGGDNRKDKDALGANTAGGVKKPGKQEGKYKMLG